MEPVEVIEQLKKAMADVKSRGEETVAVAALETYLDDLRSDATQSLELPKLEYQRTLRRDIGPLCLRDARP